MLDIRYKGLNIHEVLQLTVKEAISFFSRRRRAWCNRLKVLDDVGLGYLRLGQSATTLSGGEAQRVKLAAHLAQVDQRRHALHLRRADHRPALRRHRQAAGRLRAPDRERRQHPDHRTQPGSDPPRRLGDRPRSRRRRARRRDRRRRNARTDRGRKEFLHRAISEGSRRQRGALTDRERARFEKIEV